MMATASLIVCDFGVTTATRRPSQGCTLWYIHSLNFVIVGLLGEGVASSTRIDPQAKGLGEYLRSRIVDLPEALLEDAPNPS